MIFEEFLSRTIHQYFDSIFKRYEYSYSGNEESERDISYFFARLDRMVRIHYNYPNNYLDIFFYRETDIAKYVSLGYNSLAYIMKDKNPMYTYLDYDAIMPDKIPLEKSLETLSELLEQYATTYLDGTEWKTWWDVQ